MSKLYIKTNYGVAPNILLNNKRISLKAKGLFTFLQSKPNEWAFSIGRIAGQTDDGKSAIRSAIKELEEFGYLQRMSIKNEDGRWNGYDYMLSEKPLSEKRTSENPMSENLYTLSKKENSKKDISKKDIEYGGDFNKFWEEYPKKEAKKKAQDIWKRKKLNSRLDEILNFIRKAKQTDRWKSGYILNPTTFLNQERWEDELTSYNEKNEEGSATEAWLKKSREWTPPI